MALFILLLVLFVMALVVLRPVRNNNESAKVSDEYDAIVQNVLNKRITRNHLIEYIDEDCFHSKREPISVGRVKNPQQWSTYYRYCEHKRNRGKVPRGKTLHDKRHHTIRKMEVIDET
jgi:hypothetical protein